MTAADVRTEAAPATPPHPGAEPRDWYTSPALLEVERRRLFDRSWSLVGTAEAVAGPGAFLTATVGTSPLLVVRGRDGVLRAFHNLCRHRGVPLVEGAGHCGRFLTCPYHQWSYELGGDLVRVPQADTQFPDMDAAEWGLHPAAVAVWKGMVFAHPDADAPSLASAFGELGTRLEPFLAGPLAEVATVEYTVACNWKLLVENHIDVYHLWFVHSRSLGMYDHSQFGWELLGDNWWSLEPLREPAAAITDPLPWLDPAERDGIGAYLLFPNLMLVTTGSYFATYDAVPLAPDRTRLTLRVRSTPGADAEGLVASIRSFMAEDVTICERLQSGVGSSRFGLGPLARSHERPIHGFHQALARTCYG
ncbi:MAG TPA: aromatic ring-hydroxylating dioxygenase subunit alpha [Acidimicrobiales bacterium]|nr:aromatic ring-hydroxylating dioxygenase subunit alpha [Acidimicrobiales bacterium]